MSDYVRSTAISGIFAGHVLAQVLGRTSLPARRQARMALCRIEALHGTDDVARSIDFHDVDNHGLQALSYLVLASFRPDWVRSLPEALDYYHNHPDEWERDIITAYWAWLDEI